MKCVTVVDVSRGVEGKSPSTYRICGNNTDYIYGGNSVCEECLQPAIQAESSQFKWVMNGKGTRVPVVPDL